MNTDNENLDTISTDSNEENKFSESPKPSTSKSSNDTPRRHRKHCCSSCNLHKDAELINSSLSSNEENKFSESPKPSTSIKSSNDTPRRHRKHCCSSCNLHKDAEFIKSLFSNFEYSLIYKILRNNQLTDDPVKHALCDLSQMNERLNSISSQLANKRKVCCSCMPYCDTHSIKIRKQFVNDEMGMDIMEANQLDTSNNVEMCKDDLEKLISSKNYSKDKKLQSNINLTMPPIKTEIDATQPSTSTSTPSIPLPNIATSSIAASNTEHQEILLNEKANKIYCQLISMFPNVDQFYIKQLCQTYFTDSMQYELYENLVEFLLENDQKYSTIKEAELLEADNANITYNLNNYYADLLTIFPEANPLYLRRIVEENYKNPEKIQKFVQSKLNNPDYPTRAQYLTKKITEQQKQYTTNFNIQQFLDLFPDPFAYFENATRECKFNVYAIDFLMHYFSRIKVITLLNTYSEHQYNLSLTVKALEASSPDKKSERLHNMILTKDILLLQECAFIQHKLELKKYVTKSLKNQEEFEKLKARNELVVCQCCTDECIPSNCFMCKNEHLFCNKCIKKHAKSILRKGEAHINCLLNCGSEYPLSVLQQVLSTTNIKILLHKRLAEVMAGLNNLIACPFCHFPSTSSPEDKVFRCFNCMKEFCPHHLRHLHVEERTMKNPYEDGQ